jgi:hypothetical protein
MDVASNLVVAIMAGVALVVLGAAVAITWRVARR